MNPGINSIWKDEIERRRLQGVASSSQITAPESQERLQAEATHATEDKFQQILWSKIQSFFGENVSELGTILCSFRFYSDTYFGQRK